MATATDAAGAATGAAGAEAAALDDAAKADAELQVQTGSLMALHSRRINLMPHAALQMEYSQQGQDDQMQQNRQLTMRNLQAGDVALLVSCLICTSPMLPTFICFES